MKIKTSELTRPALDWAVAKCEGLFGHIKSDGVVYTREDGTWYHDWNPSKHWSQGGPIIEREEISTSKLDETLPDAMVPHPACWSGHIDGGFVRYGPTPLIAAMRCYVVSKLGSEVDVPNELV